jgi:hypothetical protein
MPQIVQFEGQAHQFPDDFTPAEIQPVLRGLPRAQSLPEVTTSDRRFPFVDSGQSMQPVQAPQNTSTLPPLPRGCTLDLPSGIAPLPPDYVGAIEPIFYFVLEGVVTLCDETGSVGGNPMQVGPGDDPRRIAALLKRSTIQPSDFNRPLDYAPWGIA